MAEHEAKICEPGGHGMLFPLLESEQHWSSGLRAALYIAALLYLFLGVNIVADKFVASIEIITSQKRRVRQKSTGRVVTVAVWNSTVANLTLMALGSSSPEILLSVVETVSGNFFSGELGPGTIVGSAAFNLFMIVAASIVAVPCTEVRRIKEMGVYAVTVVFSLFAYIWLVIVCSIISPDVIEVWEALVTLLMMPVLVWLSYLADIGYFSRGHKKPATKPHGRPLRMDGERALREHHHYHHDSFRSRSRTFGQDSDLAMAEARNPHGILGFPATTWELSVGFEEREVRVPVLRMDGLQGSVGCRYQLEGRSAKAGYDFEAGSGHLRFGPGEERAVIVVKLLPKRLGEHHDEFQVVLEDASGGATFDPDGDGGEERSVLTVTIRNENENLGQFSMAMRASIWLDGVFNTDAWRFAYSCWRDELSDAIFQVADDDDDDDDNDASKLKSSGNGHLMIANGSLSSEGESSSSTSDTNSTGSSKSATPPTALDWIMHIASLPWKVLFAVFVPPAPLMNGWPCFSLSLVFIGGLTAFVIDFAELFGCVTHIQDSITAITLVALGTSMPDLFASRTAAVQDDNADASIVNVTGSNSVNVFLGIGLPWSMSAIYWSVAGATPEWLAKHGEYATSYPNGAFIVKSGDLVFGVVVFTAGAIVALAIIHVRRVKFGGELGGAYMPQVMSASALAMLWFLYCGLSIWKIIAGDADIGEQAFAVFIAFCSVENLLLLLAAIAFFCCRGKSEDPKEDMRDLELAEEEHQNFDLARQYVRPMVAGMPYGGSPSGQQDRQLHWQQLHQQQQQQSQQLQQQQQSPGHQRHFSSQPQPSHLRQQFRSCGRSPRMDGQGSPLAALYGSSVQSLPVAVQALSFSNAAMVCLAVKRFKAAGSHGSRNRAPLPPPWESRLGASPRLSRDCSFHSLEEPPTGSATSTDALRAAAGSVAGYLGQNALDLAALGAAGLAASQVLDLHSGGGRHSPF